MGVGSSIAVATRSAALQSVGVLKRPTRSKVGTNGAACERSRDARKAM